LETEFSVLAKEVVKLYILNVTIRIIHAVYNFIWRKVYYGVVTS
jgi:hypothetical protein